MSFCPDEQVRSHRVLVTQRAVGSKERVSERMERKTGGGCEGLLRTVHLLPSPVDHEVRRKEQEAYV